MIEILNEKPLERKGIYLMLFDWSHHISEAAHKFSGTFSVRRQLAKHCLTFADHRLKALLSVMLILQSTRGPVKITIDKIRSPLVVMNTIKYNGFDFTGPQPSNLLE